MPTPEESEIPDWVKETPPDHMYCLDMFESGDNHVESIDLTRDEYIALKRHLAAVQGHTTGTAAGRVEELVKQMGLQESNPNLPSADPDQVARYLIVAREFYRLCPEAVVSPKGDFDTALNEIAAG
jgi:hypothetical protein